MRAQLSDDAFAGGLPPEAGEQPMELDSVDAPAAAPTEAEAAYPVVASPAASRDSISGDSAPPDPFAGLAPFLSQKAKAVQQEGIRHALRCLRGERLPTCLGCILDYAMGLGKTFIAFSIIQTLRAQRVAAHALIACPAGLVDNWLHEGATWLQPCGFGLRKCESAFDFQQHAAADASAVICGFEAFAKLHARWLRGMIL